MTSPILTVRHLTVGYPVPRRPPRVVAADLSVDLYPGELVCLLGPNGVGKSTLMRTLVGMQDALEGAVELGGENIVSLPPMALARRVSTVLTERVDVGHLSVYALVALGRYPYTGWAGRLSERDEEVVDWAIRATGASELADRNVGELSDGERQKVMIARALAQEPDVMFLDEPTAFLDLPRRVDIMRLLRRLAHETGRAVLLSTHDLDLALRTADRLWLLSPGGTLKVGAPESLVLDGAFEATFEGEGVEFDRETGSFKVHTRYAERIGLLGDGVHGFWTTRALEREGFDVVSGGGHLPLRVEVLRQNGEVCWKSTVAGVEREHGSLDDLVAFVRKAGS